MGWESLGDAAAIREFCERDPIRYIFHLGDLDPSEWNKCRWYAYRSGAALRELILDYRGLSVPCLHLLGSKGSLGEALSSALPLFSSHCYLFCHKDDLPEIARASSPTRLGPFLRMTWEGFPEGEELPGGPEPRRLEGEDLGELADLLECAYPGSFFEPAQLRKGVYFGIGEPGSLAACAGLHAYSEREGVAVLGNIATLPSMRNRGYARAATAALLLDLAPRMRWIALNVETGNAPALRVYQRLGFRSRMEYESAYLGEAASES